MAQFLGFKFGSTSKANLAADKNTTSPIPKNEDGSPIQEDSILNLGQQFNTFLGSTDTDTANLSALIEDWRILSHQPDVDHAVEEITNEAIIQTGEAATVSVNTESAPVSDKIRQEIQKSHKTAYNILHFSTKGPEIFRRWYVDGRLNYHNVIDEKHPKEGIKEVRFIDPRKIKKLRMTDSPVAAQGNMLDFPVIKEVFVYNEKGVSGDTAASMSRESIMLSPDSITYIHSGLYDHALKDHVSYLQKAARNANTLQMMEDAAVVYRLARAPERQVFYVDVGDLNNKQAEAHVRDIKRQFKNKMSFDVTSGKMKDQRRFLSVTENLWLPRRGGSRGTEVDTLQGAQNLGEITDITYFKEKFFKSLNIPSSRFDGEANEMFSSGTEITRAELRFARFVQKLRAKFSELFSDIIGKDLVLRGIMTWGEWKQIREYIIFDFKHDNLFQETLEQDILTRRLSILRDANDYVGIYFDKDFILKNVMRFSEEEIKDMGVGNEIKAASEPVTTESLEQDDVPQITTLSDTALLKEDEDYDQDDDDQSAARLTESMTKFFNSYSAEIAADSLTADDLID